MIKITISNSKSTFVSLIKGVSTARAHSVLIVKTRSKCTLSILVSNLLDRQRNISIHRYLSYIHEIDV